MKHETPRVGLMPPSVLQRSSKQVLTRFQVDNEGHSGAVLSWAYPSIARQLTSLSMERQHNGNAVSVERGETANRLLPVSLFQLQVSISRFPSKTSGYTGERVLVAERNI